VFFVVIKESRPDRPRAKPLTPPGIDVLLLFMVDPTPMAERHGRALAELGELGLALARKLQARAMDAETAAEERAAATSFHRISRSVRQTLALEAQLERLRRRMLAEEVAAAAERAEAAVTRRKTQARSMLERLIWREHEDEDAANVLVEHMQKLVDEDALEDDFLAGPLDAYLDRLRDDLNLAAERDEVAASGDSSGVSASRSKAEPDRARIPASAQPRGEGHADPPPPPARWAGTWPDSS
jgi:hypothetical protein